MNDNACTIILNLINMAVRMMPIFVCLEPKHRNRENIAAVSAYLWAVSYTHLDVYKRQAGRWDNPFRQVLRVYEE